MLSEERYPLATALDTPPFLRWAGSKRWLVDEILARLPERYGRYYEPFLGSGSAFFAIRPKIASLSDTIVPLVQCYEAVRDDPEGVHAVLAQWEVSKSAYYQIRELRPGDSILRAAQFIFLNKTAFNGLYRVNRSGIFNVPYGRPKSNTIVSRACLEAASQTLQGVQLEACDFELALKAATTGDLIYLDPPYVAGHRANGFVDYNSSLFSWDDQVRLRDLFHQLDADGAYVMLSNANHPSIVELYSQHSRFEFTRHSSMAAKSQARGLSSEILVLGHSLMEVLNG